MSLFNNKYRIEPARLSYWDYSLEGTYFITICTKSKQHFFGQIQNDEMIVNSLGMIVKNEWLQTIDIRPDMNLELDTFVIMPNHFHAIISIGANEFNNPANKKQTYIPDGKRTNKFGPQYKNLSAIVRGFKSAVTKQSIQIDPDFGWQSRFHDHIIRNHESHLRIQNYILNNPHNWEQDTFYTI